MYPPVDWYAKERDYGECKNCGADYGERGSGRMFEVEGATITGTGTVNQNVFILTGTVEIINQWAEIKSVTTLNNCTGVYADLWDGTNSVELTSSSPAATLSGAPVGTFFSKKELAANPYVVSFADQCRLIEIDKKRHQPFTITANNSATTYIRFNYQTTDTPVLFTMDVYFEWIPLNGGRITEV